MQKIQIFDNFNSALYSTSGSMSLNKVLVQPTTCSKFSGQKSFKMNRCSIEVFPSLLFPEFVAWKKLKSNEV